MKTTLQDYLVLIVSIIGSLASIFGFGLYFANNLNEQGWVGVLFLGILSCVFLIYNCYLITKYRFVIRYSDVFEDLNVAFSELHNIDRGNTPTVELIVDKLGYVCDNIAQAFNKLNGHNIGVCIKILSLQNKRPIVLTLVRDKKSITNNRNTGQTDKTIHYLDLNSDFEFIYSHFEDDNFDTSFYYEANLPVCKDYKNTRLKSNWAPKSFFPMINFSRRRNWPLKYKSTMVVPIVPLKADEQSQNAIRGFLCIDSPYENSFNVKYDVNILKGICDGLYNKIDSLDTLTNQENGK